MTTEIWILLVADAIVSYLIGGINPAIVLSRLIYRQDIRTLGSGNPGFTNFKRVFGGRYAWFVFALDIAKAALVCTAFSLWFRHATGYFHLGAAYTGLFAMLGHSFPVWYRFRGGKGFLVAATAIWFMDWRVAAIAGAVMMVLLFTVRYMSLSVMIAGWCCPVLLALFGTEHLAVILICIASVLLMTYRHKGNIRRLIAGTESKFYLGSSHKKTEEPPKS